VRIVGVQLHRPTPVFTAKELLTEMDAAGADPAAVRVVDFDEVPLPYLPGNATRIRCKAVGDLRLGAGA